MSRASAPPTTTTSRGNPADRRPALLGTIAVAYIALTWGYSWIVTKKALAFSGPLAFQGIRFTVAGGLLLVVLGAMRRPLRTVPPGIALLVGVLQTGANFGLVTWAALTASVGRSAFLCYLVPVWVAFLGWPLLRERPKGSQVVAMVVALAGIGLLASSRGTSHGRADVLALGSGLSWALGVVVTKKYQRQHAFDPFVLAAWQMLTGGLALAAAALVVPGQHVSWAPYLLFALVYAIIPATVVGWSAWFWLQQRLPAGMASMGLLAIPPLVPVFAAIELHERPTGAEIVGMVLIALALVIVGMLSTRAMAGDPAREERDGGGARAQALLRVVLDSHGSSSSPARHPSCDRTGPEIVSAAPTPRA